MERAYSTWLFSHGIRSGELAEQLGVMTVGVTRSARTRRMVRVFDELDVRLVADRVGTTSYVSASTSSAGDEVVTHGTDDLRLPLPRGRQGGDPGRADEDPAHAARGAGVTPRPAGRHCGADDGARASATTSPRSPPPSARRPTCRRSATSAALYARAVDDHDIDTLVAMFTPDGVFERRGVAATGADEVRAAYVASFDTYRTMLHTAHPGVVQLHGDGTASGWSHGHAELATKSTLVMASYRYEDDLRRVDGRWLFARRSITFMYAVPADEMATSFGSVERIRWPRTAPEAGDYPETSPTWDTYREADGRPSRKAVKAARCSAVPNSSAVASTDSLNPPTASRLTNALPTCVASGEWAAISVASCTAAGSSSPSGCTSCTRPARSARAASISRPLRAR